MCIGSLDSYVDIWMFWICSALHTHFVMSKKTKPYFLMAPKENLGRSNTTSWGGPISYHNHNHDHNHIHSCTDTPANIITIVRGSKWDPLLLLQSPREGLLLMSVITHTHTHKSLTFYNLQWSYSLRINPTMQSLSWQASFTQKQ